MKAKINNKDQRILATPQSVEDLWHLEKIIVPGSLISGRTYRTYKPRPDAPADRKPVNLTVETEKVEFSEYGVNLRVTGKIIEGRPEEFVQVGSYHTIEVKPNDTITIQKEITSADRKRFKMAIEHAQKIKVGIVVIDDESAAFSKVLTYGVQSAGEIHSNTSKRDPNYSENFVKYLNEVSKFIETTYTEGKIIVGGTGFTKDSLKKYLEKNNNDLLKRMLFVNTSVSGSSGVNEIIKNSLSSILHEHQLAEEANLLEKAMTHLGKDDGLCVYGYENVKDSVMCGATELLLVYEELIKKENIKHLLDECDKKRVEYVLFSSESDSGRKLKGLGGLMALLRFKIN
ncbi:mRNA surveillance protein pelota [Candidatus Micrarchaeota archaeon]|nr:mRNA surveillance protein pelota [Candidatus Micrarchaeota archaeon]